MDAGTASAPVAPADAHAQATIAVLQRLLQDYGNRDFAVRLCNGVELPADNGQPPRFSLVLNRPDALYRMLVPPSKRAVGEAYVTGAIDLEGDSIEAFGLIRRLSRTLSFADLVRVLPAVRRLRQPRSDDLLPHAPELPGALHSPERDDAAIRFHYDIGTAFYALWLDRRMVYSCSYFPNGDETLEESQLRKLDHICRKLRLQPGERFLDLGCGFGGLVIHAAQHYGVQALGITLSREHGTFAQQRIRELGLEGSCRVEILDYRNLPTDQRFDKIAAIGIIEHIGENRLDDFFQRVWTLLKPGSVFLNHGICWPGSNRGYQRTISRLPFIRRNFIHRHIFPDLDLLPLHTILRAAGRAGFEVRDVENLREHYAITLRLWLEGLDANWAAAVAQVGQPTARLWRAYLAYSSHSFTAGDVNLIHTIFAKPDDDGRVDVPMTREYMYGEKPRR